MVEKNAKDHVTNFVNSKLEYEKPNPVLNSFKGKIITVNGTIKLSDENLILRGSVIENTEYAYGVVIYVGYFNKKRN